MNSTRFVTFIYIYIYYVLNEVRVRTYAPYVYIHVVNIHVQGFSIPCVYHIQDS